MAAITVQDLRKDYGGTPALDGVSFTVEHGEVFALVGPNGAGKSTTVEILEGHRRRSSGSVTVLGTDPATGGRGLRERIGIVLQEAGFDEDFSVRELLHHQRAFYPRRLDVDDVIAMVGLTDKSDARVKTLSGGQRRRLDLALGLIGDPELLFLDEPTTGFDPSARHRAWDLVDGLRARGTTVLLTTHYMEEAERLADRVGILVAGRLVALGTPAAIGLQMAGTSVVTFRLPSGVDSRDLPDLGADLDVRGLDCTLRTSTPTATVHLLTTWAMRRGDELPKLTVTQPTLEDVYLQLVTAAGSRADGVTV